MGMFFENYHIKMSDGASQEKIKKAIESAFAKQGYVSCDDESATKSLVLRTSETGKWMSMIFAEENEGEVDREFCSNVFLKLVEQMDAYGLIVNCVDSDFAMLRLVSIDEDIDSAITIGDSYTGEVTEKEALRDWESVADTKKLYEVCCGDYTFAEEGLEKAAELLGLDKNQVFLTEDDTSDESLTTLYFKKKNQRRKSFKTMFLEIFEEGLKDEGFVRVKSKYPYLARMVSEEVYQVITYKDEWCTETYEPETKGCRAFSVMGTFVSVYNPYFEFDITPEDQSLYDLSWYKFYADGNNKVEEGRFYFIYDPYSQENMKMKVNRALIMTKDLFLSGYTCVVNVDSCLRFNEFFSNYCQRLPAYSQRGWEDKSSEGCLYVLIEEKNERKLHDSIINDMLLDYKTQRGEVLDYDSKNELNRKIRIIEDRLLERRKIIEDDIRYDALIRILLKRKKNKIEELNRINIIWEVK